MGVGGYNCRVYQRFPVRIWNVCVTINSPMHKLWRLVVRLSNSLQHRAVRQSRVT